MRSKTFLKIPEGVKVRQDGHDIIVTGPRGEIKKGLFNALVEIKQDDGGLITFHTKKLTKKEKCVIGTFSGHITNMFNGVLKGFVYKLRVCSWHFPMSVNREGSELVIKNFLV